MKSTIEEDFSTLELHQLAKESGFMQRSRKLSPFAFLNTLMFLSSSQQQASLEDMIADLNQQFEIDLSKEALHKRFTSEAVLFLKAVIKRRLEQQFAPLKEEIGEQYFSGIIVKDSSKFSLPSTYDEDYPSFGNFSKMNGIMNFQYEYDLVSGEWQEIKLTNIKTNDQKESNQTIEAIKKGHLYIRDLGYITPTYLKGVLSKDAYYLNRLPAQVNLYKLDKTSLNWTSINNKFKKTGIRTMDMEVLLYKKEQMACRLVIEPVSDEEYQKRLEKAEKSAKSRKVAVSKIHKIRCRYNTYITNVCKEKLPAATIRKAYYLRWQIELVFKTWKSFFEINKVKKVRKERLECQLLAKLVWILLNWRLFQTCNKYIRKQSPQIGISVLKFFKRCLAFAQTLRMVVLQQLPLDSWLENIFIPLIDNTKCEALKGKKTHYYWISEVLNT